MRDAFVSELTKIAERDPMISLVTGDLGFGVLTEFANKFPDQFINAGVSEQNMTGLAAGLALEGHSVYTYSIGNFSTLRCLEHIRNDICYHDCNVTVVCVGGGFSYGQLGVSHFAIEDLAIMRSIPNMTVIAPADPWEAAALTKQMALLPGPKYLRLDKASAGLPEMNIKLGEARVVRDGDDVTLVSIGSILSEAITAADLLEKDGIFARVLAVHSLTPIDHKAIVCAAKNTGGIVSVEEHIKTGGLAGAIAETCLTYGAAPKFFFAVGLDNTFPSIVGDQTYLRHFFKLDAESIYKAALNGLK